MRTFLEETISNLLLKYDDISQLVIVLPSKRAGGFFTHYLRKQITKTSFLPKIISIEEFVELIADIRIIDNSLLLLESYNAYLESNDQIEKEDFENFSNWIQTLLNDFNEIDRYLVDPKAFFDYLGGIKSLEKWNVVNEQTELITNYLAFWNSLPEFYETLKQQLLVQGKGYQGMVYRKASEEIEHYTASHGNRTHIFIGFNALNKAEQTIIKELLETGNSEIIWDADSYFFEKDQHSVSTFMRGYFKDWKYYNGTIPKLVSNFEKSKQITVVETQKNISQAKYVGQLLSGYSEETLNNTAVVLADERLLVPLLYSLPKNIDSVNITMGVPLKNFPTSLFFLSLLGVHSKRPKQFYYKDVFNILNHPAAAYLIENSRDITNIISSENRTYTSMETLLEIGGRQNKEVLGVLFGDWEDRSELALENILKTLLWLKPKVTDNPLEKVLIFQLFGIFKKVQQLINEYSYLEKIKSIQAMLQEDIGTATLDYKGNAYNGLQIMGVLETRGLDFQNIIMTSVNEGLLPSGKSSASFITYDLKKTFELPLFTDKDAIYTYHFYRLLHRAENIHLLYNGHSEGLNTGEKSRFILQLEIEGHSNHTLSKQVLAPTVQLKEVELLSINKSEAVMDRIKEISAKGYSPSALTSYIRNPVDFFFERVLNIDKDDSVEETVDFNTLGTIVHNTLEIFYKPFQGSFLSVEALTNLKPRITAEVGLQFQQIFRQGVFNKGKNLLIFEVAKRYVENLINMDISELEAGNNIKIVHIEKELRIPLTIPELDYPVHLRGIVDRVDEFNGALRIIDYKTSNVERSEVEIIEWPTLTSNYKYNKAFQVLAYSLMMHHDTALDNATSGIISFKNMTNGYLKFGTKTSARGPRDYRIDAQILELFSNELKSMILEISNPKIPFVEKEV